MPSGFGRITLAAVAAALITAGAAVALDSRDGHRSGSHRFGLRDGPGQHDPAGPLGSPEDLTYAEIHAQQNGDAVVLRVDRGKVKSTASDSLTITENDGNEVTIPTDDNTHVLWFGKQSPKVSDLQPGQQVIVKREQGQPAKAIMVPPEKGARPFGMRGAPGIPPHGPPGPQPQ